MIVYNSKQEKITLDDEVLSSGGEGAVYKIKSPSSLANTCCVKVYYENKRTAERRSKIEFMVKNPPKTIERHGYKIGWPLDTVFLNKAFAGFIMPLAYPDSRKLTILTGLTLSKRLDVSWQKYDRRNGKYSLVARMKLINNIAIPIFLLHATGMYVIQDFKPDNVLITHNGMVTLCDMDSIQITKAGQLLFRGTAATMEYAPPEFANLNVGKHADVPVDVSWDNFAIAAVFYQLIFGIHPFAVTPKRMKDDENNELSTNIARLLFPFGANAGQVAVIPKPHNNFKVVPAEMQSFFIKAFSDNVMSRPGAQDWGKLIHRYISEAGDVPMPTPKPAPKPSTTSGTAKPRPTGTTTTRPKPKPPVTPQVPDDESDKKSGCPTWVIILLILYIIYWVIKFFVI